MKSNDRVPIIGIAVGFVFCLVFIVFYPSDVHTHENRIKHLEMQVEVLRERCDDLTLLVNRVNALEATTQHQQEALDIIDWAVRYRY